MALMNPIVAARCRQTTNKDFTRPSTGPSHTLLMHMTECLISDFNDMCRNSENQEGGLGLYTHDLPAEEPT